MRDGNATVIDTVGEWTLVMIEQAREGEWIIFESPRATIRVMGVCERCGGSGNEPDGKGKGHGGSDKCRRCGGFNPTFAERFGYDVDVYAAEVERALYGGKGDLVVKEAQVSMGSIGGVVAEDARLRAKLLLVAAEVAERYTNQARVALGNRILAEQAAAADKEA